MTRIDYNSQFTMEFSIQEVASGSWCATIDSVNVEFGMRRPAEVFIAKELASGSCNYKAVLEHELEHVAIGSSAIRSGSDNVRAQLPILIKSSFPLKGGSKKEVHNQASAIVEKAIDDIINSAISKADAENAAIDTVESYHELSSRCPR